MNSRFSSPRGASRGRARGPRVATCYICGRAYGISSLKVHPGARVLVRSVSAEKVRGFLQIHQKSCKALWEKREALKPKRERRPLPEEPADGNFEKLVEQGVPLERALERSNEAAFDNYNKKALIPCEFCGRTFLPDRLVVHNRSCTADKPARRLISSPTPAAAEPAASAAPPVSSRQDYGRGVRPKSSSAAAASQRRRNARQRPTRGTARAWEPEAASRDRSAPDVVEDDGGGGDSSGEWESFVDGHTGHTYYHNHRTGQTQWEPPIQPRHTSSSAATENRSEGVRAPVAAPNTVDPVPQPQLPPAVVDTLRSLMFRMSRMHQELDSMKDELAGVVSLLQVQFGGTGSQGHK